MESVFSALKVEQVRHCNFSNREEGQGYIFDYIEVFYNRQRLPRRLATARQRKHGPA
jgi:putative transposase